MGIWSNGDSGANHSQAALDRRQAQARETQRVSRRNDANESAHPNRGTLSQIMEKLGR